MIMLTAALFILLLAIVILAGISIWHHISLREKIENELENIVGYFSGIIQRVYSLEQTIKTKVGAQNEQVRHAIQITEDIRSRKTDVPPV